MRPVIFGIDPKWNSLLPLVAINILMLMTLAIFAFLYKKRPRDSEFAKRHTKFLGLFLWEYWAWFISPIERLFVRLRLSPNFLTTLGFLLSAGSGLAFATGHFGVAGWLMIFGGTFDMFDGRIARKTGMTSKSGAFYDSVMDRYGEAVVFLGLGIFYRESWVLYLVLVAWMGSQMVSYTRAKGDSMGVECKGGVMQRPDRIVYLGVGSIFSPPFRQLIDPHAAQPVEYLAIAAIAVIAFLTVLSAMYRLIYIFRKLKITEGKVPPESRSPFVKKLTHRYLDS